MAGRVQVEREAERAIGQDLRPYLAIPSVAAQRRGIAEATAFVERLLQGLGADVKVFSDHGNRSVRPTQNYPKVALTLTSCFIGAGFTVARWPLPEPDPPQADAVELTAYVAKLVAALRSRSCVV